MVTGEKYQEDERQIVFYLGSNPHSAMLQPYDTHLEKLFNLLSLNFFLCAMNLYNESEDLIHVKIK